MGKRREEKRRKMFQFLIGTVKTLELEKPLAQEYLVSIPHRYCKNTVEAVLELDDGQVSIPHRYCKNTKRLYEAGEVLGSFNSS